MQAVRVDAPWLYWASLSVPHLAKGAKIFDAALHLGATTRRVGPMQKNGAALRFVELTRQFKTGEVQILDVITQPARLGVWYGAVTGDLRAGAWAILWRKTSWRDR
jgi:hypothetical protein